MKGKKIAKEAREALMKAIDESGASIKTCCEILLLSDRRYYRWKKWTEPKKRTAWNKTRPEEITAILEVAKSEEQADLRAAGLMVYGHETGKYFCSPSTVQKTLKNNKLAAPYEPPRRKRNCKKPDVRDLITAPNHIYCYDGKDFFLTNGLKVTVVPILDIGSRKNLKNGVYVKSFDGQDIIELWDATLFEQGIDTSKLAILSDRGSQMKCDLVKKHLTEKWSATLLFARPYTPDDNPWIEAYNKSLEYHPARPERFETVQDVVDWADLHGILHNDYPHSSLGYVRPNDEHAGLGNAIRQQRKENLKLARKERLAYYYDCKARAKEQESGKRLEIVHNFFALC
jgi:putative transposase